MKECEYRLPCNWCDKFNKFCDMVEPVKFELPDPNKCNHDWEVENYMFSSDNGKPYYVNKYICRKCHESKATKTDINGNLIT